MRLRLGATLALVAALDASTGVAASAQELQHLTVTSFTLSADTTNPKREIPFHLLVRVHVLQRVVALKDVELPVLAALELLGDENGVTAKRDGTEYREVITVVAHSSGIIHIAPATLDAIDARDGQAKEYFSNPLTLNVVGSPLQPFRNVWRTLVSMVIVTIKLVLALLVAAVAVIVVARAQRARSRIAAAPPRFEAPAPAVPERDPLARVRDAYLLLRAEPTRAHALIARGTVRRMVGASDDETLGDVIRRRAAASPALRNALITLERAAFTHDADLRGAISDALDALEQLTHGA